LINLISSFPSLSVDRRIFTSVGYEELNNGLTLDTNLNLENQNIYVKGEFNSPCRMYTLNSGYVFNDNPAINGKYADGNTDFARLNGNNSGSGSDSNTYQLNSSITQDNKLWQIEGVYRWTIHDSVKIGGIIGYQNSETTINGKFALANTDGTNSISGSGKITQKFDGPFIGALVTYNPTDKFELGTTYRWFTNPNGSLDVSGSYDYISGSDDENSSGAAKGSFNHLLANSFCNMMESLILP
jgi:hypothetical protein